jgi:glycosyltransferase involved in cell wall biosynthesis
MTEEKIDVLHAVTVSLSLGLMRGQLRYLKNVGFRPAALCSPGFQVEDMRTVESVPVFTVAMEREVSPVADLLSLLRIWRCLRNVRPMICNASTPKAGLLVGLAAWLIRVPCRVYTLRGLRLETARGLKRAVLHVAERIACGCAHRVVCVSPSLRQRAVELGVVRENKALVLRSGSSNGVDPSRFAPTPERLAAAASILRQRGVKPTSRVIGYVGRLTRDKGLPELLIAFGLVQERFPDAILMVIGNYEAGDPVSPETHAAIEKGRGVMHVEFPPEIGPYYLAMDVLVLPTHREGFPNTVLEAQAAERPVVTTYATGAVDSISRNTTGLLVPVGDTNALADALIALMSDPALAQQMGRSGRERVCREFNQETLWQSLVEVYRELLQERGLSLPLARNSGSAPICAERL